jgi:hypothetical protein
MMVARHVVPGICTPDDPSRRVRSDCRPSVSLTCEVSDTKVQNPVSLAMLFAGVFVRRFTPVRTDHTVPYGTSLLRHVFQALRGWLPSFNPYGMRIALLALLTLATSVSGDPAPDPSRTSPAPPPSANPYAIVNHIGEADQQVTLREDKLLAHRRTIDPFGIAIRGKFKGLPPVEQHPAATNLTAQAVKAVTNELTLEKAIQQLPVGALNIIDREALIGVQSIREGDLLLLELSGHRFVVWVESIDRRGVQFCDINLQHHALKPFRFGPTQLPQASATGQSDVRDFLKQDGN